MLVRKVVCIEELQEKGAHALFRPAPVLKPAPYWSVIAARLGLGFKVEAGSYFILNTVLPQELHLPCNAIFPFLKMTV
jgi:hypothetical protein